jgi:hypothetical protein
MLGEGKGKGRFFILSCFFLFFVFYLHNSTSENTLFCLVSFGDMIGDLRFLIWVPMEHAYLHEGSMEHGTWSE